MRFRKAHLVPSLREHRAGLGRTYRAGTKGRGMMKSTVVVAALLVSGCAVPNPPTGDPAMPEVKSSIEALDRSNLQANERMTALEGRVFALEIERAKDTPASPKDEAAWVVWENLQAVTSNVLSGYRPDKPLTAYASKGECLEAAQRHVEKQENASVETLSYVAQGPGGIDRYTYSCLPAGVDPRIRR